MGQASLGSYAVNKHVSPVDVCWGQNKISLRFDSYFNPEEYPYGYEPEVMNAMEHFVEPGDCVIDAGASVGLHTCFMSKLVGETGIVMAFEPHLESFGYLAHHVHVMNKLNNVACLRMALWKTDWPALKLWTVENGLGYSSFHRYKDADEPEIVEGRSLDTLLINDHPRLIKIDCEGTEAEVLCGAAETLGRGVDCVIMELNYNLMDQTGRNDMAIRQYMQALGYDMFLINLGDAKGGFRYPHKVLLENTIKLEGGYHVNVMFSTEEKVAQRWTKNT